MPLFPKIATHGIVKYIRTAVNRAGLDITREPFHFRYVKLLNRQHVDCVIDVGANTGQFAEELRSARFAGRIVSVEPLAEPFDQLVSNSKGDNSWVAVHAAIADVPGRLKINVSGQSVASSALPMLATHSDAVPTTKYVAVEEVDAITIDQLVETYSVTPQSTLLKVDVQGFESSVLDGAAETLSSFAAVQLELSLVPLYEGQVLMPELVIRMDKAGFDLWLTEPAFIDPITGRMYQCDGIFMKRSPD